MNRWNHTTFHLLDFCTLQCNDRNRYRRSGLLRRRDCKRDFWHLNGLIILPVRINLEWFRLGLCCLVSLFWIFRKRIVLVGKQEFGVIDRNLFFFGKGEDLNYINFTFAFRAVIIVWNGFFLQKILNHLQYIPSIVGRKV